VADDRAYKQTCNRGKDAADQATSSLLANAQLTNPLRPGLAPVSHYRIAPQKSLPLADKPK